MVLNYEPTKIGLKNNNEKRLEKRNLLPFPQREGQNKRRQKCDDRGGMTMKMRRDFFFSRKLSNKLRIETNQDTK